MSDALSLQRIVHELRKACLSRYMTDIDPMPAKQRADRLGAMIDNELLASGFSGIVDYPLDHLVAVLNGPRLLKHLLRRVSHAWDVLHGEIDFDDLLVMHSLQYGAPENFCLFIEPSS